MASDLTPEELAELRKNIRFGYGCFHPSTAQMHALLDMAERCADYDRRLSEVMPVDFKDWHQNSRREWPEVAAWSITNLRERLEQAEEMALFYSQRASAETNMLFGELQRLKVRTKT